MQKQYEVTVVVKGADSAREAHYAVLAAFAVRNPDGCRFETMAKVRRRKRLNKSTG